MHHFYGKPVSEHLDNKKGGTGMTRNRVTGMTQKGYLDDRKESHNFS
ncbi:MAG: hypothetical protein ACR5K9_07010 [Wolbachia sp.]